MELFKYILALSLLITSGCAVFGFGVYRDRNGDHQFTPALGGVPLVKEHILLPQSMQIRGHVAIASKPFPTPVKFKKVRLVKEQKTEFQTLTDVNGAFVLNGEWAPGSYEIVLDGTEGFIARYPLQLGSDKRIEGLEIVATPGTPSSEITPD